MKKNIIIVVLVILVIILIGFVLIKKDSPNILVNKNINENQKIERNCGDKDKWVKIISPEEGKILYPGQKVSIKWRNCNISNSGEKVNISFLYLNRS